MSTKTRGQSREVILALLRTGDARALLAAALIVVTLTLTVHTKAGALEDAGRVVLYVGASSVSVSSAREAGAISRTYANTAILETLLALGFSEESATRYVVDRALASVTERPVDPDENITAQAALEAGAVYLAQSGARPTEEAGPASGETLASAGPVRPELGDGTVVSAEDHQAKNSLSEDQTPTRGVVDPAEVGSVSGDGGDLAYAGGSPDTAVAMHSGPVSEDPVTYYQADPTSNEGATLTIIPSPIDTGAGENVPETNPRVESETGPASTEEQVPTTLAGESMDTYPSVEAPAGGSADDGKDIAVVPGSGRSVEDAANDQIDATAPHQFPGQESSTTPSAEEPDDEQSPAIILPADPTADEETASEAPVATEDERDSHKFAMLPTSPDERLPAPAETSTPDSEDRASGEATMGVPASQEQTAEGFEDDAREQVVTTVVGDEPDQHVTVADGEGQDKTPQRSPEPAQDGGHPRLETAESTDATQTPPETTSERKMSSAEGAPEENWQPDQRNNRAPRGGPANELETNDPQPANPDADVPRGNPRDEPVTVPPGERRDGHGRAPAEPEDDIEDGESTHVDPESKSRAPRDNAPRHPAQPVDAPETTSRQSPTLSESGTRRPSETLGEDPTWRATKKGDAYRDGAVGQARLQRTRQDRLAARRTTETFEPSRPEPENRGQGWRVPPATDGRAPGRAGEDRSPHTLAVPTREEDLD